MARPSDPPPLINFPRFDGAAAWAALTVEQCDEIGVLALELVAAWNAVQVEASGQFATPIGRAAEQAQHVVTALLEQRVHEALPDGQAFRDGATARIPVSVGDICRGCGCTHLDPCEEGCGWAEPGLCTVCADKRWEISP